MMIWTRCILWTMLLYQMMSFHPTLGAVEDLPWRNADKLIKAVCPNTQVCELTDRIGFTQNACCKACSCGKNPFIRNKCFLDKTTDYETCMYPITKRYERFMDTQHLQLLNAYPIITKCPVDGCPGPNDHLCNENDITTFAPVFSYETNRTYFNKQCARCHGVATYENWGSLLMCDAISKGKEINFDKELQTFLENPLESACFIHYQLQVRYGHTKCSLHTGQKFESLFYDVNNDVKTEAPLFGMSLSDIIEACLSNFYAPVFDANRQKWYPNAFCYVYANRKEQEVRCEMANSGSIEYMTLLNPKTVENMGSKKNSLPELDKVCPKNKTHVNKASPCRPLNCPLGHILIEDSKCSFIGEKVIYNGFTRYALHILLKPETLGSGDPPMLAIMDVSNITDKMQIPEDWKIIFVANETGARTIRGEQNATDELLIGFFLHKFEDALEFLKHQFNRTILISDGVNSKMYVQNLYALSLNLHQVPHKDRGSGEAVIVKCPMENTTGYENLPQKVQDESSKCWRLTIYNPIALESVVISKLYYCNLVQLYPNEFELHGNGSILYNKLADVYLFQKEFVAWDGKNGDKMAKVCLEDSGFGPVADSAPNIWKGYPVLLMMSAKLYYYL